MNMKVTQSCLTLCNPMDCPWNSIGQITGVGSLSLFQGIFPTQGLNPDLPYFGQILYQQSHKGSPPKSVKWSEVAQSCLTLWNPMDCSLPGSSIHGVFQAIILEWVATSFSRGSSQPRDRTQFSCIVDRRFTAWATRKTMFLTVHCVSNLGLSFIYSCGS